MFDSISGYGGVNLSIAGTTNADKVLVQTHGDGLIGFDELILDSNKNFKQDSIGISFNYFSEGKITTTFEMITDILAIKGDDTLVATLKSGLLKY